MNAGDTGMITRRKLKLKSKYMEFEKIGDTGKTEIWLILSRSSGFNLGTIKWYGPWRQYCFFPSSNSVFNRACIDDINGKITELMDQRKYR